MAWDLGALVAPRSAFPACKDVVALRRRCDHRVIVFAEPGQIDERSAFPSDVISTLAFVLPNNALVSFIQLPVVGVVGFSAQDCRVVTVLNRVDDLLADVAGPFLAPGEKSSRSGISVGAPHHEKVWKA